VAATAQSQAPTRRGDETLRCEGGFDVKIGSFNLMSYRHLPADFSATHESVWVNFDVSLLDAAKVGEDYNATLDELEYAAEVGFDFVGVNEHHNNAYGLMPSPNLMAAALARRTKQSALLVLGNSLALYNPPQRVAEELAMIDCISGGRLIAGFPVGTSMDTCYAYGTNPSELRDRYYEAHDLVMAAWKNPKPFAFNGRFNQQRYVNITPRPLQDPHPPVWIPAGGSVETWRFCAEHDYVYCYLTYYGYQSGEKVIRGFWDEMKALGKPPNPYQAGVIQFVGVADSFEEALKLYAEPASYFFNNSLHIHPRWTVAPGYQSEATIRKNIGSQVKEAAQRAFAAQQTETYTKRQQFREMVDKGFVLIGSPDQVAEKIREVAISQNVGNMILMTQFGNMSNELARYNVERIAREVMPQVSGIFANDWEHQNWPRSLAAKAKSMEMA
jgi:alkanesulfonate monooxygenase SsuD/methylene tetrahydromethanopterin reductase-like flavin-dependent oxidoreductase (luciferase family)